MKHNYMQLYLLLVQQGLRSFMIMMPIIVIYWQDNGLSLQDIFLLQVVFSVALVALEVPSGYFADRFSRVSAIRLGSIATTGGYIMLWYGTGFGDFIVAELLMAVGFSLISGANEALLHETLDEEVRQRDNLKWQGRLFMTSSIAEATAAITASLLLLSVTVNTVVFIQWMIIAMTIPIALLLREKRHTSEVPTPSLLTIVHGSYHGNKRLRALNLFAAGVGAAGLTVVWFTQPVWESVGVALHWFGYLWAGLNALVALGASMAHRLEQMLSFRTIFTWITISTIGLFMSIALLSKSLWVVLLLPMFWIIRGITHPIIVDYVQRESNDNDKATVLSINKLGARLVFAVFSPFLGYIADIYSFAMAFTAAGLIFGTISILAITTLSFVYQEKQVSK